MPTISDAQALSILRESNMKTLDAQSRASVAAQTSQIGAKQLIAKTTADAAKGDQLSSISKMAASGMGTLLNSKLNMKANLGMSAMDKALSPEAASKKQAMNAGLNAATQGNGVGNVVTQAADAFDQNVGFAKASSDAKIAGKFAEMQDSIASQSAEAAKANKDKATKGLESVEDFAKDFFQRAKAVIDKMF